MRSLIFRLHARRSNLDKQVDVMKLEGGIITPVNRKSISLNGYAYVFHSDTPAIALTMVFKRNPQLHIM